LHEHALLGAGSNYILRSGFFGIRLRVLLKNSENFLKHVETKSKSKLESWKCAWTWFTMNVFNHDSEILKFWILRWISGKNSTSLQYVAIFSLHATFYVNMIFWIFKKGKFFSPVFKMAVIFKMAEKLVFRPLISEFWAFWRYVSWFELVF
jgi:hypothetical protein